MADERDCRQSERLCQRTQQVGLAERLLEHNGALGTGAASRRGHENMPGVAGPRDRSHGGDAIALLERDIHEDHVRIVLRCGRHRTGLSLCSRADMMTQRAQQLGEQYADEQIVFHQKNTKNPECLHDLGAPSSRTWHVNTLYEQSMSG
jgi:hypothetical protein